MSSSPKKKTGGKAKVKSLLPEDLSTRPPFDVSATAAPFRPYEADEDPYTPHSRATKLKSRSQQIQTSKSATFLTGTMGIGGEDSKPLSSVLNSGPVQAALSLTTSMHVMERAEAKPRERFPEYQSENTTIGPSGMTISLEPPGNTAEGKAELEVLKAVLNREGYLMRLFKSVRTVNKKFKADIADILDLVRAASLDVVEAIVKWREVKNDHDAAFMWNGLNYLLKMPSDMDYLSQYLAVQRWMGFPLVRNPFCVPFPMEQGVPMFAERVLDPRHIDPGMPSDGFLLGGITHKMMRKTYAPQQMKAKGKNGTGQQQQQQQQGLAESKGGEGLPLFGGDLDSAQSFVLNSDMRKIRQAELVILKEEEKLGVYIRDPEGHVIPRVQALTRIASLELRKDDHRPLEEKATTSSHFAPHAAKSDIGVAPPPYIPEPYGEDKLLKSDLLHVSDETVDAVKRGNSKIGGNMAPLAVKGGDSRLRRPLNPTLGGGMDFFRQRGRQTLGERLEEITKLKAAIEAERAALAVEAQMQRKISSKESRNKSRGLESRSLSRGTSRGRKEPAGASSSSSLASGEEKNNMSSPVGHKVDNKDNARDGSYDGEIEDKEDEDADDGKPNSSSDELKRIEKREEELKQQLRGLNKEVRDAEGVLNHISKSQSEIDAYKIDQRTDDNRDRSQEIERKRRLLPKDTKRSGQFKKESENVYDFYAKCIQSLIRGWLARCWTRWYRLAATKAAIVIQAGLRGWIGRLKVRIFRQRYKGATDIQRMYRGYKARGVGAAMAKNKNIGKAALIIQRYYRGSMGRQRTKSKRQLAASAKAAIASVDARTIFSSDVRDLAKRILFAIEEPLTTSFPPDEVLHLIRITVMIIQAARGLIGVSDYNFINKRSYKEFDGEYLTWMEAGKVVIRSERFLRLVRVLAFGPGAKPPRVIQLPPRAKLLLDAQKDNPRWCLQTFETMGRGNKFATQLFLWVNHIADIATRQVQFLAFIASNFPDWLPKLYEIQSEIRKCEFHIHMTDRCIDTLQGIMEKSKGLDPLMDAAMQRDLTILQRNREDFINKKENFLTDECNFKEDQVKKEEFGRAALFNKVCESSERLREAANMYKYLSVKAAEGDKPSEEKLPEARIQLTEKELEMEELKAQLKLLIQQVEKNTGRRKMDFRLPPELRSAAFTAGEAKALNIVAIARMEVFLRDAGVKYAKDLPDDKVLAYKRLEKEYEDKREVARVTFKDANDARRDFDLKQNMELKENEVQEQKSRAIVNPSDAEMEEERREDDKEAKLVRAKAKQFLPELFFTNVKARPRPVIVALSRDIPGYAKTRMHNEITKLMPGIFVSLDVDENMGLDADLMQKILDSQHSIIMTVDVGLTRFTRDNFIKNFDMTVKGLIPVPFTAIAFGDESNKMSSSGGAYFGASKRDIILMRDREIKAHLEAMSWALSEMSKPEIIQQMQVQAHEILPSSPSLVLVLEALLVCLAVKDDFFSPDSGITPGSWHLTQRILAEPRAMVAQLRAKPRGQFTLRRCECLNQYLKHRHWPLPGSAARSDDAVLNLLALYVERLTLCEKETLTRGGPSPPLTKGCFLGCQAAIVVTDGEDPEDFYGDTSNSGWRMPAIRLIRTCLQDLRIMKSVCKIDDITYHVSVYRERDIIYFDVYDPKTSQVYMTSVRMDQVPGMLMPNAFITGAGTAQKVPTTEWELASQLVNLLLFDRAKGDKNARKQLLCRRDYTFLSNYSIKLQGHRVFVKAYEAALGELYFRAYFPQFSAHLTLLLDETMRLKLFQNCDKELEAAVVEVEDARVLLPYIVDRLRITPSRNIIEAKGIEKYEGYTKNAASLSLIKSQGFAMKVRLVGGAGRLVKQCTIRIGKGLHILQLRSSSLTKTLRIQVYEPYSQSQFEVRINSFFRKLLLKSDEDDFYNWLPLLVKRLKLNWRGGHKLLFDATVYRTVRKVGIFRIIVAIGLVDEDKVHVTLTHAATSRSFASYVSKESFVRLLHYMPVADVIKSTFGKNVNTKSQRNILKQSMIREQSKLSGDTDTTTTGGGGGESESENESSSNRSNLSSPSSKSGKGKKKGKKKNQLGKNNRELDPVLFEAPMYNLLSDTDNIINFVDKLELLLQPVVDDFSEQILEFNSIEPPEVPLKFAFQPPETDRDRLDMSLFYIDTLKKDRPQPRPAHTSTCCVEERRQRPVFYMEEALNDLALQTSKLVFASIEHALELAEHVDAYVESIGDDEQVEKEIQAVTVDTTTAILEKIEQKIRNRMIERAMPGVTQETRRLFMLSGDGRNTVEVEEDLLDEQQREILGRGEILVVESGVKTNFRDIKSRWAGHVSIKVYETICWQGEDGVGRRLRFEVFDPITTGYYEGLIRNSRHLLEVCGVRGRDLLIKDKTLEMVLFIAKYRMFLVKNDVTFDGDAVPEGEAHYRVEFESERLFGNTKVTPIDRGGEADEEFNKTKLIELNNLRGKKILRLARRVSGVILQLTVFEVPPVDKKTLKKMRTGIDFDEDEEGGKKRTRKVINDEGEEVEEPIGDDDEDEDEDAAKGKSLLSKTKIAHFEAPTLRVIGYDSRSKRKVVYIATPELLVEKAGGPYSPYLDPNKRRDLAKILCESLQLIFPRSKPFELFVPWSGSGSNAAATQQVTGEKLTWRSGADRVIKRSGKIFRSAMRISKLELLVTLYVQDVPQSVTLNKELEEGGGGKGTDESKNAEDGGEDGGYEEGDGDAEDLKRKKEEREKKKKEEDFEVYVPEEPKKQLICNFYSTHASEATELVVSEEEQIKRLGKPLLEFTEGIIRATAVRRFCRYFHADLIEDPKDMFKKVLKVQLIKPRKDFVQDYRQVGVQPPGEDIRPVGYPQVFLPLNTCGRMLHRRGMTLTNQTNKNLPPLEYVVTVYTKTVVEGPERGLVVKMYERGHSETAILHLGTAELQRLITEVQEPDLLKDIVHAKNAVDNDHLDNLEEDFVSLTTKGDKEVEYKKLVDYLIDIVLAQLGVKSNPEEKILPYIKSHPRGIAPN